MYSTCHSLEKKAYEIFRIKNGIPKFPNELNDEFNPHEVNLSCDVSPDKGCYIGQEVIARLQTYDKVQKKMKGLLIPSDMLPERDTEIINKEGDHCWKTYKYHYFTGK